MRDPDKQSSRSAKGAIFICLASVSWSTTALLIKMVAVSSSLLSGLRCLIAGLILIPCLRLKSLRITPLFLLVSLVSASGQMISSYSYRLTTATNASALFFSSPLWIFIYGIVFHRNLDRRSLPGVLLITLGIITILLEPNKGNNAVGNILAAFTGIINAFVYVSLGKTKSRDRMQLIAFMAWMSFAFTVIFNLLTNRSVFSEIPSYPPSTWFLLLIMALTQTVIPYILLCEGMKIVPVQRTAILSETEFILAPVWTLLLLHEIPTSYGMAGWLLVLLGLLVNEMVSLSLSRKRPVNEERDKT